MAARQALAATEAPVSIFYAAPVQRPRQVSALQSRWPITAFGPDGHFSSSNTG
jgi:hypothetical protein